MLLWIAHQFQTDNSGKPKANQGDLFRNHRSVKEDDIREDGPHRPESDKDGIHSPYFDIPAGNDHQGETDDDGNDGSSPFQCTSRMFQSDDPADLKKSGYSN